MPEHNTDSIALPETIYTRADYTALRAHCLKIPLEKIAKLYYSEDSYQVDNNGFGLEKFLIDMRSDLIERAIVHNPALAENLQKARMGGAVTTRALEILIQAADIPAMFPSPLQPITMWFRPRISIIFKNENVKTLGDLSALINNRGPGWWRCIPRIGLKRSRIIVHWLKSREDRLGYIDTTDYTEASPAPLILLDPLAKEIDVDALQLAPLGQFRTTTVLDGSQGINRCQQFCFIRAKNDLEAIESYLFKFADKPHTMRSYRKELERFLLWSILVAKKPMSSLLVDDCETYKHFLRNPSAAFIGLKTSRFSSRWRPFSPGQMSAKSQKHAITVIRAAFQYFTGVRYLGGNPWIAVNDPSVTKEVNFMQIERALPDHLWKSLIDKLSARALVPENSQDRVALATLLLLGDSGLRREEVAGATRGNLKSAQWGGNVKVLTVLGKRNTLRDVPISARTLDALQSHWADRHLIFNVAEESMSCIHLISPVHIPLHSSAKKRHEKPNVKGYNSNSLYALIKTTLKSLSKEVDTNEYGEEIPYDFDDVEALLSASPHSFRHTFGTLAVAAGMPLDVAQSVLGHASSGTTAIYVQAKKKRMLDEASKYFEQMDN